jgi:hypothetical protein
MTQCSGHSSCSGLGPERHLSPASCKGPGFRQSHGTVLEAMASALVMVAGESVGVKD